MYKDILKHFANADPLIHQEMLTRIDDLQLQKADPTEYFVRLCRSIIYQQLSGKAASTIYSRFEQLFPNPRFAPEQLLKIPHESLRGAGLSNAKANYVKNIAEAAADKRLNFHELDQREDEEVIELLTQIKGVGRWTAEMFLIFPMARENVFSFGDLGLKKGFMKLYGFTQEPTRDEIELTVEKWAPYKTYGSLTLWRVLDNE